MSAGWPADWLVPQWPAPARVRAVCTTRAGGVSAAPWDSFNLGDHVGDDAAAVAVNRQRLRDALGARPVFLQQVHGGTVIRLAPDTADGTQADGCMTDAPGLACTVMVADCLPVLLADDGGRVVAAAHAGWRGLAGRPGEGGILEQTVASFRALSREKQRSDATKNVAYETQGGSHTREGAPARKDPAPTLHAWLGPAIGPQAFEVGPEVRAAFLAHDTAAAARFRPGAGGKWWADLPGLARDRLAALGVASVHGNDGSAAWCTVTQASRFFSHRRDRVSGRMAACIWLV